MPGFVALLRAINVGGAGKLPMSDLREICQAAGLRAVRTYIASGNVVFESDDTEAALKALLEERLAAYAGKPMGVLVRTAQAMAQVLAGNPFAAMAPSRTVAIFLDAAPSADLPARVTGRANEIVALGAREIYVHYPDGMGRSKLRIPGTESGTARNMNTIAALAGMAGSPAA